MSLRRSARNAAKPAVSEVIDGSNQNGQMPATSVVDTEGNVRSENHSAPSPELPAEPSARKKVKDAVDVEAPDKKKPTPKPAPAPRKRKAPATKPKTSTDMINDAVNTGEVLASNGAPPESMNQTSPEDLASISRGAEEELNLPSTPVSKRRKKAKIDTTSPAKSAPSGLDLLVGSKPKPTARKARKSKVADHVLDDLAPVNRPAAPDVTNAPVLTPNGSQVVIANDSPARKRKAADLPPDVGSPLKPANSTAETLLRDAEKFLISVDETGKLERLIGKQRCKVFSPEGLSEVVDPFTALASGIMGQQVSGAAAASIRKKFTALFSDTHPAFPSPSSVLTKDIPTLRTAGLSQRKAEYITGLAEKFASGEFTAEGLVSASDEELIEKLVAVRGLGRWSVEMFACFGLKRMDVFSTGDLGVQRGMAAYMGRDVSKLKTKGGKWKYMSEQEMLSIASRFSPYRSLFMWYMWRIADVETEVLE